jgi:serine/threonine-protein kinase
MPQTQKQQIGRYEILEEIGRGAMGVVFKGHDPLIGRLIAVKTITAGVAENPALLERFYREARAAGGLQHPNIVTIYELAESGGAPFIAMEYLEGESLEKIIARSPALPLATRLGYVLQTCRALDYAHRRGVIHRDVKPANIVVTRDGAVKVVDFGIARLASASQTQTGTLLGTLAYMSPEQLRGQNAGARSDIWALGVVLYELTAYQRPFTGENHGALLLSILQKEPPPIRQLLPECPVALERVVLKSLRKNDKERYQSMEELLKDLENFNVSLMGRAPQAAAESQIPSRTVPQPSHPQSSHPRSSQSMSPAARPAGAAPIAKPEARPLVASIAKPAQPNSHPGRKVLVAFAILAVMVLAALGFVRRYKISALPIPADWARHLNLPAPASSASASPDVTANTETPAAVPPKPPETPETLEAAQPATPLAQSAPSTPVVDAGTPAGNAPAVVAAPPASTPSRAADLQRVARQEQALWDKATAYLRDGDLDDADKSLRDILTLPQVGPRWSEAAHYVDQVIPDRRREQQLWAAALFASTSQAPGHLLVEVKTLDELLAAGGTHQKEARQMRDTTIAQLILGSGRRRASSPADGDQWQMARLKNHFDELVQQGDATALDQLQDLQSKFQSLDDGQEPLATDARDYMNSVIPKARKHIEDSLAAAESNSSANAAYTDAVKQYSRALAAQNSATLRDQVLPLFTQIAQSGGLRAKEAQRYVDVLVPAALKASAQQE